MRIFPTRRLFNRLVTFATAGIARTPAASRSRRPRRLPGLAGEPLERRAMLALTIDVPSNVLDGINATEAAAAPLPAVEVTAGAGEIVIVTFTGADGAEINKPLVASGGVDPVDLEAADFAQLSDGEIAVSVRNYTTPDTQSVAPINLDRVGPGAPALALGPGVSDGATLAEATQQEGIVTVQGEVGSRITVIFTRAGTVTKGPIIGTGAAQPVTLTSAEVATLGDGPIAVSATQTDAVGNPPVGLPASISLVLDATPPVAPTLTLDASGGVTLAEALAGFVDLSAAQGEGDRKSVV